MSFRIFTNAMLGTYKFCKKKNQNLKESQSQNDVIECTLFRQSKPKKERKTCYSGRFSLTKKCYLILVENIVEVIIIIQSNNKTFMKFIWK